MLYKPCKKCKWRDEEIGRLIDKCYIFFVILKIILFYFKIAELHFLVYLLYLQRHIGFIMVCIKQT